MSERWAIIEGYSSYAVSSHGRVRNLNTGKALKPQSSKRGGEYLFVNLYRDSQRKNVNIHSLVAVAFLGPRPHGAEVHHKDTNRRNPRLDNLEYLTPRDHGRTRRKQTGEQHHSGEAPSTRGSTTNPEEEHHGTSKARPRPLAETERHHLHQRDRR